MTIQAVYVNKGGYPREKDIIKWATDRGILQNSTREAQLNKLEEELYELFEAVDSKDKDNLPLEIGDMYVLLTLIANMSGLTMDQCVEGTYEKIKDRKGTLDERGIFHKEGG